MINATKNRPMNSGNQPDENQEQLCWYCKVGSKLLQEAMQYRKD